jgi:ribosomal protein S18 acetylase RimI-like enzyme
MPGPRFEAFTDAHLDDAAKLLEERHRRHLANGALLAEAPDLRHELEAALGAEGASGSVLLEDGAFRGYVIAAPQQLTNTGLTWMLVGFAGFALDGHPELTRDLYAHAATRWVEQGHTRHGLYIPASETEQIDAWFRLCFGASAVTAARETGPEPFESSVSVRDGTPDDVEDAARLDRAMADSMQPAPSFSGLASDSQEFAVDEWRDTWEDEQFKHFVAELDGRTVGHLLLWTGRTGLRIPAGSIDLAAASTEPEARGAGVGRALTAHALTWAQEHGYPTMTIDWRMTNLLASRFWPKRGFRPTFLRMYRSLP